MMAWTLPDLFPKFYLMNIAQVSQGSKQPTRSRAKNGGPTLAAQKGIRFAVIATVLSVALSFMSSAGIQGIDHHDNQRLGQVIILVMAAVILVWRICFDIVDTILASNMVSRCLAIFFALGLLSSLTAWSVRHALYEWASFGLLIVLAWLIANEIKTFGETLFELILRLCGGGCALYVLLALEAHGLALAQGIPLHGATFVFISFDSPRFFNYVQTVSLPLLGLLTSRSMLFTQGTPGNGNRSNGAWRRYEFLFWSPVLIFWWMLLFASGGRGAFTGIIIGMTVAYLYCREHANLWIKTMALSCLAGLFSYFFLYFFVPQMLGIPAVSNPFETVERTIASPVTGRYALWRAALEMISTHPFLGVGPLHYAHYDAYLHIASHPHNWLLQIACEWGIIAAIFLSLTLAKLWQTLVNVRKNISQNDSVSYTTLTVLIATYTAILVDGIVSGLIVMPASQLWIALYGGCTWGWLKLQRPTTDTPQYLRFRTEKYLYMLLIITFSIMLVNGLWPEVVDLEKHRELNIQENMRHGIKMLWPRLWSAGYF